jgi:crossover junction endonuclease EME1
MYMSEDLRLPSSAIAASLPEIEARFKESLSAITYLSVDELPVPGIIRFKRNHTAKWDSKRKAFIPLDKPYWDWERTTLIVLAAGDLVDKLSQGGRHLIDWVKDTRLILGVAQDEPIGILIQGLGKMLAQRRAAANRQYTAAARAGLSSDATSRLDTSLRPDMDKDAIDAELVKLQVAERVFIVHRESNEATIGLTDASVEKTEEIEDWIWNLAADVAIRPVGPVDMSHTVKSLTIDPQYKLASKSHLSFAPTDHPKKAVSITNALELMLQEVQGVTQSAAAGIAAQYPTFADLMEAFERAERSGGVAEGQSLLEDCEVGSSDCKHC